MLSVYILVYVGYITTMTIIRIKNKLVWVKRNSRSAFLRISLLMLYTKEDVESIFTFFSVCDKSMRFWDFSSVFVINIAISYCINEVTKKLFSRQKVHVITFFWIVPALKLRVTIHTKKYLTRNYSTEFNSMNTP